MESDMSSSASELKPLIYRAGAGAGKTTKLVSQVISIAEWYKRNQDRFPRMIVTTFTRKATQELRERLLQEAQKRGDQDLISFVLSKRDLHISTIHGVLSLLLSRYGFRIGLDPGFGFVDPVEARRRSKSLIRELTLKKNAYTDLIALFGVNGLAEQILKLDQAKREWPTILPHDRNSLEAVAKTFLRKSAGELERVAQDIERETNLEKWLAFAQVCRTASKILASEDSLSRCSQVVGLFEGVNKPAQKKDKPAVSEETNARTDSVKKEILKALESPAFDSKVLEEFASVYGRLGELGKEFSQRLEEIKKTTGQLEIDDLELTSLSLLRTHPDIGERFSEDWDYWLIDEFQDTSPVQVELLTHLIGKKPHFVVGDPQQSIYFFRGARSEVFSDKEREIENAGGRLEFMETNYRSEPELLSFINDLMKEFGVGFRPMKTNQVRDLRTTDEVAVFGIAESVEDELKFIASEIKTLIDGGVSPEQICILARKHATLMEIGAHLERRGFPTLIHASSGFFERREILDMLGLLKFFVNPHDDRNLVMLLRSPWFRVPDAKLVEVAAKKEKKSFWSWLRENRDATLESVESLFAALEESNRLGTLAAFENALIRSGLIDFSHYHDVTGQRESNIWKLLVALKQESVQPGFNLLSFIGRTQQSFQIEEFEGDGDAVAAFEPNRVNLMTVHAAKGLQFPYVFIPRIGDPLTQTKSRKFIVNAEAKRWCCEVNLKAINETAIPIDSQIEKEYRAEQERLESERLFYVALTRAKRKVYLSCRDKRDEESWFAKLKWDLNQEGICRHKDFVYRVERGGWFDVELSNTTAKMAKVLNPVECRKPNQELLRQLSVSRALDELFPKKGTAGAADSSAVPERISKATTGVFVHRVFEVLHYKGFDGIREVVRTLFEGETARVDQAVDYVKTCRELPLAELIENGNVEWGFLMRYGNLIVEGQIDLWGKANGEIWVVDYKTGSPGRVEKAFEQLKLYALALKQKGEGASFKLAVVFPFDQKTFVREFSDFNSLEAKLAAL